MFLRSRAERDKQLIDREQQNAYAIETRRKIDNIDEVGSGGSGSIDFEEADSYTNLPNVEFPALGHVVEENKSSAFAFKNNIGWNHVPILVNPDTPVTDKSLLPTPEYCSFGLVEKSGVKIIYMHAGEINSGEWLPITHLEPLT